MRLRARIVNMDLVPMLSKTINTISKQTSELILRFTKSHMYLISNSTGLDESRIWCEIPVNFLFALYTMEGASAENDEIFLKLSADPFANALRSINQNTISLKLKLTQKPSIHFFIQKSNFGVNDINFNHEVLVDIISRRFWPLYEELTIPPAEVTFEMPRSWYLKMQLDKMKSLSKTVEVRVEVFEEDLCSLKLNATSLSSEMETVFKSVKMNKCDLGLGEVAFVNVDIKRLSTFFNTINIVDKELLRAKVLSNQLLHLSLIQDQIFVHFSLPHVID